MLKAGFAEIDITPTMDVPMGRLFINVLRPERVRWPPTGRIAVFSDGASITAIIGLDLGIVVKPSNDELRAAIAAKTGLNPTDIMIACTHTHNGPAVWAWRPGEGVEYLDFLKQQLADGVAEALEALTAGELTVGSIAAPGWCYNRRPVYRGRDGKEHVGTHGPRGGEDFLRMEGPEDKELQAVLCRDGSGRPLGGLINFACHPTNTYNVPAWSADFIGPLVESLRKEYGCPFVFLNGACGNLSQVSGIPGRGREGGEEHAQAMGEALAMKAIEALAAGRTADDSGLRILRREIAIPQRRPTAEMIELAQWYLTQDPESVDQEDFTYRMYGHPYTMYHNSHSFQEWIARETLGMWEWQRRAASRELIEDIEVQVIRIGDVALASVPCEYFTEFGLEIKEKSPLSNTLVVELANGWHGYIPTYEGYEHGGYEARFAYQNRLIEDAGYMMRDTALELLKELI